GVGIPARTPPLSLSGHVRPNGGPSSMGQAQDSNKEGGSVGPGFRPELVKSTTEIQREEASGVSLFPGLSQL
ncbi:hypothetical protein Ancab_033470, partial [Ancistrocladus abbreviatus]